MREVGAQTIRLQQRIQTPAEVKLYKGTREDGTPKGPGFFGELAEVGYPDLYATELPLLVYEFSGSPRLIPLITPDSTYEELAHLVTGGGPTPAIRQWATEWARRRLAHGQSPFAAMGEQRPLPAKGATRRTV